MTKKAYLPCPEYDVKLLAMAVPSGVVLGVIPGVVSGPSAVRAQVNRRNGQLTAWTDNHSNLDDRAP